MGLLQGETVLMSSDNNTLVLTNYRVRYDAKEGGASRYIGITLDAVSSCGLVTRSHPILLILAAIAVFGGFAGFMGRMNGDSYLAFGLVIGAILLLAYFLARSAVFSISSNGGEAIVVPAKGMAREKIVEFLQAVEDAKLNYLLGITRQ